MGQHKNSAQMEILIRFMELHPDLVRGFVKGDKVHHDQLWLQLAIELNASGPPTKEAHVWRKVWTDWKLSVKQRLGHNRVEAKTTGGGRFNKCILSTIEEQVAVVSGLYTGVDGVKSTKTYGAPAQQNVKKKTIATVLDGFSPMSSVQANMTANLEPSGVSASECSVQKEQTSTAHVEQTVSAISTPTTPRQVPTPKRKSHVPNVGDVLNMEVEQFTKMSTKINEVRKEIKENRKYLKELSQNTKELSRNIRELRLLKDKEIKKMIRHNNAVEKSNQTKNELKSQFLELEQIKLGLCSPPCT